MKVCSRCRLPKPLSEYTRHSAKKDGLNPTCKGCHRQYTQKHYRENKGYYVAKALTWNAVQLQELTEIINTTKDQPCKDCGRKFDPVAMDLDHVRGTKVMPVSVMRLRKMSKAKILTEIAKCEVRCAVCHRLRTHRKCLPSETDITQVYET